MPKTRPQDGDTNWGVMLNNHLAQTLGDNGGINTADSDPTLTVDDEGYTYINTTTREIRQWDGGSWQVLIDDTDTTDAANISLDNSQNGLASENIQSAINEVITKTLSSDRITLHISDNGDDSNDGLSNSSEVRTLGRIKEIINSYSPGHKFDIITGTLTLTESLDLDHTWKCSEIIFLGFSASSTTWTWTSVIETHAIKIGNEIDIHDHIPQVPNIIFQGISLEFNGVTPVFTIRSENSSFEINDVAFGSRDSIGGYHMFLVSSKVKTYGTCWFKGGAATAILALQGSIIEVFDNFSNGGIVGSDTFPHNYSSSYLRLSSSKLISHTSTTFSRASDVTGQKYDISGRSEVLAETTTNLEDIIPGDTSGVITDEFSFNFNPYFDNTNSGLNAITHNEAIDELAGFVKRKEIIDSDTNFYVNSSGDNNNDGQSSGAPWQTLEHALSTLTENYILNATITINVESNLTINSGYNFNELEGYGSLSIKIGSNTLTFGNNVTWRYIDNIQNFSIVGEDFFNGGIGTIDGNNTFININDCEAQIDIFDVIFTNANITFTKIDATVGIIEFPAFLVNTELNNTEVTIRECRSPIVDGLTLSGDSSIKFEHCFGRTEVAGDIKINQNTAQGNAYFQVINCSQFVFDDDNIIIDSDTLAKPLLSVRNSRAIFQPDNINNTSGGNVSLNIDTNRYLIEVECSLLDFGYDGADFIDNATTDRGFKVDNLSSIKQFTGGSRNIFDLPYITSQTNDIAPDAWVQDQGFRTTSDLTSQTKSEAIEEVKSGSFEVLNGSGAPTANEPLGRMYFDSTSDQLYVSKGGGTWVNI